MTSPKEFYEEDFFIFLTIEGTEYENIEVKVSDPHKTIRNQINSIIQVFELPMVDNGGNYIQYILGQMSDESEEPEILDFEDEDGHEQCFFDYNVQPNAQLYLIPVPLSGCPPLHVVVNLESPLPYDNKVNIEEIIVNVGELRNKEVCDFIKYLVRTLHLPLFYKSSLVEYTLSIWDNNSLVLCETSEQLIKYIITLIKQDIKASMDLRIYLNGKVSKYTNYGGAIIERLLYNFTKIVYKKYLLY